MASSSYAKSLLGGLAADVRSAMGKVLDYIVEHAYVFGPIDTTQTVSAATNLGGRYVKVITSATANQEVAVAHGGQSAPTVMIPCLPPSVVNARFVGDLTITRAADANRIYVSSASTGAVGWIYVE